MTMPWVCNFSELDKTKLSWVGGKGANLGELTQQGFPVPGGFCVTTEAYHEFLQQGEPARVEDWFKQLAALEPSDTSKAREIGATFRAYLMTLDVPSSVEEAILQAWEELGSEHSYAVRSSATAEDLPDASFAGQQDTYLNVKGCDSLLEHVRRCWVSLFTDRAIVYRAQNQFDHREVALSVVVQRMVLPEVSGIMFTVDPLSENRNILSIDASYGLGEALVSGKVAPDLYRVDKRDGQIVDVSVADKGMAIRPLPDGGTFEEDLVGEQRKAQVLTEAQTKELAALGARIEEHYGTPQDIEWCLEDDAYFVVQSRPITSLYPGFSHPQPETSLQVYFCFNHLQVMTEPITPMGQSCIRLLLPFGKWDQPPTLEAPYLNAAGGRLYVNLTKALRNPRVRKVILGFLSIADSLTELAVEDVVRRKLYESEDQKNPSFSAFYVVKKVALPVMRRLVGFLFFKNTEKIVAQRTQFIEDTYQSMRKELQALRGSSAKRMHRMIELMGSLFREKLAFNFLPVVGSGILSAKLTGHLTGQSFSDPDMVSLMRAYEGNVTTEMDLELGDLADVARRYPAVVKCLRETPPEEILDALKDREGGDAFLEAFAQFLAKYGVRGTSEIDIGRQRWSEDPTPLLQMIIGNLAESEPGKHRKQHQRLAQEGEEARDRLIQSAGRGFWGWLKKPLVRRLTRVHRNMMGAREHPKWLLIRVLGLAKEVFKDEGEQLVEAGVLSSSDAIFYLTMEEVLAWVEERWDSLSPNASPQELVEQRKSDYQRWKKLNPPRVLTSEGEIVRAELSLENAPEGAIVGSAASAGIIEGRARVILSPKDAVLQHGEILVAPFTDPGWTPLFIHAGALVMEVGGLMTHGSVVAREYGIPAVVCVANATTRIETGQWIRVNGDQGYVEILEEPNET